MAKHVSQKKCEKFTGLVVFCEHFQKVVLFNIIKSITVTETIIVSLARKKPNNKQTKKDHMINRERTTLEKADN